MKKIIPLILLLFSSIGFAQTVTSVGIVNNTGTTARVEFYVNTPSNGVACSARLYRVVGTTAPALIAANLVATLSPNLPAPHNSQQLLTLDMSGLALGTTYSYVVRLSPTTCLALK